MKRDGKRGVWYVLNYSQSKEKAGHAIRDATITEESKKERAKKRKLQRAAAAKKSRQQSQDKDNESVSSSSSTSSSLVVTPEKNEHQCQQNIYSKYDPEPVGSTRDISIKSALSATLKQRQHFPPLDISSSSMDMTPIPLDQPSLSGETFNLLEDAFLGLDPFMDYIDEVLGPSPSF